VLADVAATVATLLPMVAATLLGSGAG
jgi:hypothetical protein